MWGMFRTDKWFKVGWAYFFLMFVLEAILPEWMGDENGVIENLQMLWLSGGLYYCYRMRGAESNEVCASPSKLWTAGVIYYFLLFMREISWGRVFFLDAHGSMIQYSQMGLYGKLVHPMVAVLVIIALVFVVQAKIWRAIKAVKLPVKSFVLLLLFIFMSWVGERTNFVGFCGQVAEELAEFGAYMMMFVLTRDIGKRLHASKK